MSIVKRLVEKYGKNERKVKGGDRKVLEILKSLATPKKASKKGGKK